MLAYLCHATLKSNPASFMQNTFRVEQLVYPVVCVLVDEGSQLCLNLKIYATASYFLSIMCVDNIDEKEVCHSL